MHHPEPASTDERIDVFFVGVGKCGTSWIYDYLRRRHDVGTARIKETYLLDNPAGQHAQLLEHLFSNVRPRCDFSNLYYWDQEAPQKIRKHNPNAKVVVTVRLPSERIASHFGFEQRGGNFVGMSIEKYLVDRGDPMQMVERSDYAQICDRFEAVLNRNHLLVLPLEALRSSPQKYADVLCDFIDVAPTTLSESDTERVLSRGVARSVALSRLAKRLAGQLRRRRAVVLLGKLKTTPWISKVLYRSDTTTTTSAEAARIADIEGIRELDATYFDFLRTWAPELHSSVPESSDS